MPRTGLFIVLVCLPVPAYNGRCTPSQIAAQGFLLCWCILLLFTLFPWAFSAGVRCHWGISF